MSGKASRDRGKRGEREAKLLLGDRDWLVDDLTDGVDCADFLALHPNGKTYSVEVKACRIINVPAFKAQAKRQAGKRPWLLMAKLDGSHAWLVCGTDIRYDVWRGGE
jgi:hypothetical protein